TVGRAEAVLVVVRLLVGGARVESAVVALLQLHRMRTGQLGLAEQLAGFVETALVVVTDLGDDVTRRVVADLARSNLQCACHDNLRYVRTTGLSCAPSRSHPYWPCAISRAARPMRCVSSAFGRRSQRLMSITFCMCVK